MKSLRRLCRGSRDTAAWQAVESKRICGKAEIPMTLLRNGCYDNKTGQYQHSHGVPHKPFCVYPKLPFREVGNTVASPPPPMARATSPCRRSHWRRTSPTRDGRRGTPRGRCCRRAGRRKTLTSSGWLLCFKEKFRAIIS